MTHHYAITLQMTKFERVCRSYWDLLTDSLDPHSSDAEVPHQFQRQLRTFICCISSESCFLLMTNSFWFPVAMSMIMAASRVLTGKGNPFYVQLKIACSAQGGRKQSNIRRREIGKKSWICLHSKSMTPHGGNPLLPATLSSQSWTLEGLLKVKG